MPILTALISDYETMNPDKYDINLFVINNFQLYQDSTELIEFASSFPLLQAFEAELYFRQHGNTPIYSVACFTATLMTFLRYMVRIYVFRFHI